MKKMMIMAAALALGAGMASAEDYALEGMEGNCAIGNGGEGIVSIGSGEFHMTETHFARISPQKTDAKGFKVARYEMNAEGEPLGETTVGLKFQADKVIIAIKGENPLTATRCR